MSRGEGLGEHLAAGLTILWDRWSSRVRRWATAGTRRGDRAIRTGLLGAAALGYIRMVQVTLWVPVGTVTVIMLTAARAATKAATAKQAGSADPPAPVAEDTGQEQPQDPAPAEFLALVHRVIGTAGGVHLKTLARALATELGGAWEISDVRRLCEAAGQPTRDVVRAPGAGPTVGIKREDLLPLPQTPTKARPAAVVDAGQPATTGPTTAAPTTPTTASTTVVDGLRIVTTPDPGNPHRHAVQVVQSTPRKRRR